MDFLKAALQASKNKKEEVKTKVAVSKKRKWMSRGELAALEEKERQKDAQKNQPVKRQKTEESEKEVEKAKDVPKEKHVSSIPAHEVKERLRQLGHPITFFGESDEERLERLKNCELNLHLRETGSHGAGNLLRQILQQEVAKEIMEATEQALDKDEGQKRRVQPKVNKYDTIRTREECSSPEEFMLFFLKRMLREWERELKLRSEGEKRTVQGRHATANQKQTRHFMRPLFRMFKKKTLSPDMVTHMNNIVTCLTERKYVSANDHYLKMSIGEDAWPMGVTMVGIHERASREKIFSRHVAHVLNDETQRKYIQGLKRIMTFTQSKYPSDNPHQNMG